MADNENPEPQDQPSHGPEQDLPPGQVGRKDNDPAPIYEEKNAPPRMGGQTQVQAGSGDGGNKPPPKFVAASAPDPNNPGQGRHYFGEAHRLMTAPTNPYRPDTPNNDFIHGVKGKFGYKLVGGSSVTIFDVEQVSADFMVENDDITNTSSNGARVRLDGIEEVTGSITFVYDSLNVPTVAPLPFQPRTYAQLTIKPDGVTIYQFVALIDKFAFATGPKAGTVRVSCDYKSTGPITYPTASLTSVTPPLT